MNFLRALLLALIASVGALGSHEGACAIETHQAMLLSRTQDGLAMRIKMIRRARQSIALESFYFEPDRAGRQILAELIQKKLESPTIRVRILIDRWGSQGFADSLANRLRARGIEVRFYNDVSALRILDYNHRNHRKLMMVDGEQLLLGGRNIAEEHFGMNQNYNLLDYELWIAGPVAQTAQSSFEQFWESSSTGNMIHSETELDFGSTQIDAVTSDPSGEIFELHDVRFVSDQPGRGANARIVGLEVERFLAQAESSIRIEGTHFLPTHSLSETLFSAGNRGVKIRVLTQSEASVSPHGKRAVWLSLKRQRELKEAGIEIFGMTGRNASECAEGHWGTHAKAYVVDRAALFIGSYNLGPRSRNINAEAGVIITDPKLAQALADQIETRIAKDSAPLSPNASHFHLAKTLTELFHRFLEPFY